MASGPVGAVWRPGPLLQRLPVVFASQTIQERDDLLRLILRERAAHLIFGHDLDGLAKIGDAAIVNTGARIDHDCIIGSAAHIAPGTTLSGGVTVGERAWLGTGCSVRQGITIGDDVMVGVGAAVVADLTVAGTYAGVPARRLEKHA